MKKSFWQSLLSTLIIAIFAYIALASFGVSQQKSLQPDGSWKVSKHLSGGNTANYHGRTDGWGRWDGPVSIEYEDDDYILTHTEEVTMKAGVRHGLSKKTYPGGVVKTDCYQHGEKVKSEECEQAEDKSTNDLSAYAIFSDQVPWFAFSLEAVGFNPDYVKAYLDTLELLLYANEFPEDEFGNYYNDVIDVLEETAYDSIIQQNSELSIYNGFDLILNNEFRLATLHSYVEGDGNTYQVVRSIHPNYLAKLNGLEVTDADFEGFCLKYDSIMSSYDPIAADDPFLVDSLDARMYRALDIISSGEEDAEAKSAIYKSANSSINFRTLQSLSRKYFSKFKKQNDIIPEEVAEIVLYTFLEKFVYGDLLQAAVIDAYAEKIGIVRLPTVVTNFVANTSTSSVTLNGNVIEDGGGEITSRGIAWGTVYNPSMDNLIITAGTGTGEFSVDLTGLSEGQTYYARAFAQNSTGTAFGNCLSIVADNTTEVDKNDLSPLAFQIYPNPARDHITLRFGAENAKGLIFTLYDVEGKVVLQEELTNLVQGKNIIRIDLTQIESGMYTSQIMGDEMTPAVQKLLIIR